jgi:hypothetical protein
MRDRADPAAVHEPVAALDGERGITVRHGGSFDLWLMCELALHILPPKEPPLSAHPTPRVTNVTTRNSSRHWHPAPLSA